MPKASGFSESARKQAAHILSQSPFHKTQGRGFAPLRGVLTQIGQWFEDAWDPVWHLLYHDTIHRFVVVPFHDLFGTYEWIPIAVIVLAAGLVLGFLLIKRRTRIQATPSEARAPTSGADNVEQLEAAATEAEAAGDHELAVRLRFRAGLGRLEVLGAIPSRDTATTQQLHRSLHSRTFEQLARSHEAIAYAGAPATPSDSASAREGWPILVSEVAATRQAASTGRPTQ
ncbi:MAG: hypothetical protein ACRD0Z_04125 [Acidimicrobiales bacterium]